VESQGGNESTVAMNPEITNKIKQLSIARFLMRPSPIGGRRAARVLTPEADPRRRISLPTRNHGGYIQGAPRESRPEAYLYISTSFVERSNLSLRMHLRRFTCLTNAFSKKLENPKAAVTLYVAFYNFCRVHQTLRVTPAMEAGLTDHVWSLAELLS
jgi:hypothetical protein